MEARAVLISVEMECGSFDYFKWFLDGNKAHLFRLEKGAMTNPRPWVSSIEIGLTGKSRLLCGPDCTTTTPGSFARIYSRSSRKWPRIATPKPDPFTAEERDKILKHFREKHAYYYPFVATLFAAGARPSEIIALRWG
jgi:integrase